MFYVYGHIHAMVIIILFNSHAWQVQHWQGKSNTRMSRLKYQSEEDGESKDNGEASMISLHNKGYTHSTSMMHSRMAAGPTSLRKNSELQTQSSHVNHAAAELSTSSVKKEPGMSVREPGMVIKEQHQFSSLCHF